MTSFGSRFALFAAPLVLVVALACSKPQQPQLTPKEVTVTAVDLSGFDMRVKMDAYNPNGFDLAIRSVVAHVVVDGNQDLGTVTSSQPVTLPAGARSTIDVPMTAKWKNLEGIATLAGAKKSVPYTVDGTATVGGERLNVDVPFKLSGTMTPEQLQGALMKSLQGLPAIPGLTVPK